MYCFRTLEENELPALSSTYFKLNFHVYVVFKYKMRNKKSLVLLCLDRKYYCTTLVYFYLDFTSSLMILLYLYLTVIDKKKFRNIFTFIFIVIKCK